MLGKILGISSDHVSREILFSVAGVGGMTEQKAPIQPVIQR